MSVAARDTSVDSWTVLSGIRPGCVIDRSYLIHELLGEGGMGAVYRATERLTGRQVALKLVSLRRLLGSEATADTSLPYRRRLALAREFQTLASLHHPSVIAVQSYGFDPEAGPYFTMELLESPQTLIAAARDQPLAVQVQLLAQLLRALLYLHRRGLVHRERCAATLALA